MSKGLSVIVVMLWMGLNAKASPLCVDGATFDTYKGLTCTVGPLTFSAFNATYTNATDLGGNPIGDMSVTVNLVMNAATATYGLLFSYPGGGGMAVRPPAAAGMATISFDVMGAPISDVTLTMVGGRMGNGASASVGENASGTMLSTSAPNPLTDTQDLGGMSTSLSVTDTASVNAPAGSMQAQVQSVQNTFAVVVPEPGTLVLLSFGCAAMFLRISRSRI